MANPPYSNIEGTIPLKRKSIHTNHELLKVTRDGKLLRKDVVIPRGPLNPSGTSFERSRHKKIMDIASDDENCYSTKKHRISQGYCDDGTVELNQAGNFPLPSEMRVNEELLGNLVAPFLFDRETFNNFAGASRELREVCKLLPAPWPCLTLPVESVVQSISFSPCGQILAGCSKHSIHLWNRQTGQTHRIDTADHVTCISFSPCGSMLASGHRSPTSSDGDFIARKDDQGSAMVVCLWDILTRTCSQVLQDASQQGGIFSIAFSPDGTILAAGGSDQIIRLWNVPSGSRQTSLECPSTSWVYSLAFSPCGNFLASVGEDETAVVLWNLREDHRTVLQGHTESVHCVDFTKDGHFLVSGSDDETIRVWDLHAETTHSTVLEGNHCSVWALACSPDSKMIASGGRKKMDGSRVVYFWDIAKQRTVATVSGHSDDITSVAFSPSGRTLASGAFDHSLRTWNVATEITRGI